MDSDFQIKKQNPAIPCKDFQTALFKEESGPKAVVWPAGASPPGSSDLEPLPCPPELPPPLGPGTGTPRLPLSHELLSSQSLPPLACSSLGERRAGCPWGVSLEATCQAEIQGESPLPSPPPHTHAGISLSQRTMQQHQRRKRSKPRNADLKLRMLCVRQTVGLHGQMMWWCPRGNTYNRTINTGGAGSALASRSRLLSSSVLSGLSK